MIDTERDGLRRIYGTATVNYNGTVYESVATAMDLGRLRIRFQPPIEESHAAELKLTSKVTLLNLQFYTPQGTYYCRTGFDGELTAILGGGMYAEDSAIWRLVGYSRPWVEVVIRPPGEVVLEAPVEYDEVYLVGRSLNTSIPVQLPEGRVMVARGASTSLIGYSDSSLAVDRTAASIATGTSLRALGVHRKRELTLYNNAITESSDDSNPLFFAGFPYFDFDLVQASASECFTRATERLNAMDEREREFSRQAIDGYLEGRRVKAFAELKLLAAFHFMEFLSESRTLSKRPLANALSISLVEAQALIDLRNSHLHNRQVAGITTSELVRKLEGMPSSLFHELRSDTRHNSVLAAMNYIFTLCDRALLQWIGFEGATKHYISQTAVRADT